ncbi:MAG: LytTR family DNA-binding domain-containing protein [Tuberibacillus sp.]
MELETLSKVVQIISRGVQNEAAIAISDRRRFIYYQPGKSINLPIRPGEPLREGTVSLETIRAQEDISTLVGPQVFGVPYFAIGHPIKEDNQLAGCITAIFPMRKEVPEAFIKPVSDILIGKTEDRYLPITFSEIHWIYSENKKTYIHTDHGDFQNKFTLQQLEELLPKERFLRCHRSYIVNIHSIKEIHPHFHSTFQLVIKDKQSSHVPVSQTYVGCFRQKLGF